MLESLKKSMKSHHQFLLLVILLFSRAIIAMKVLQSGDTYHVSICPPTSSSDEVSCNAHAVTDSTGNLLKVAHVERKDSTFRVQDICTPTTHSGFGPADLQSAYGITVPSGVLAGTGPLVAVVIAGDYVKFEKDLAIYRSNYCLPACTVASGCLTKVNQDGLKSSFPAALVGWDVEGAIDMQMISSMCPSCKILIVVANTAFFSDMGTCVNKAAQLGK